jgi:hypothetical protein
MAEGAVGPFFAAIPPPSFDLVLGIIQAKKPVLIEVFLPEPAIKGFEISVIRRLPRPGEIQSDMILISPKIDVFRDELRAVVHLDPQRLSLFP